MPNYNPADMANMLRNVPLLPEGSQNMQQNPNSNAMPFSNFVPPSTSGFNFRKGDKELLESFGITPEEYFNMQAQLRKDNATR
jgi:hypothetical protein